MCAELNLSVVAIRGTDVGRISDVIEDFKVLLSRAVWFVTGVCVAAMQLYTEPLVIKLLSLFFPTIRIWPDQTTAVVIEWYVQIYFFPTH